MTLAQAKQHLRLTEDASDEDVLSKMLQAADAVIDYLGDEAEDDWTPETAPPRVQAAVLIVLADLWRNRGDAGGASSAADRVPDGYLPVQATRLLYRLRYPALA